MLTRAFNLNLRPMPADEYRLDLLLQPDTDPRTGKPQAGFETVAQCVAEDQARARSLRQTAMRAFAWNLLPDATTLA
jgi:hypothetical protein